VKLEALFALRWLALFRGSTLLAAAASVLGRRRNCRPAAARRRRRRRARAPEFVSNL